MCHLFVDGINFAFILIDSNAIRRTRQILKDLVEMEGGMKRSERLIDQEREARRASAYCGVPYSLVPELTFLVYPAPQ